MSIDNDFKSNCSPTKHLFERLGVKGGVGGKHTMHTEKNEFEVPGGGGDEWGWGLGGVCGGCWEISKKCLGSGKFPEDHRVVRYLKVVL